jgi:hypothetical protein
VQGTVYTKYVELDFDEVACKKVMAITSKEALRAVTEEGHVCDIDKKNGTLCSPEYCLFPADLRDLDQVSFLWTSPDDHVCAASSSSAWVRLYVG